MLGNFSIGDYFKHGAIEKFPSISKNVRCLGVVPTFSMPVALKHF